MSDNKGLENSKYKLIKNEDKLILTDKKTLKARVLEIDDIDYVVDDNQKLRDPNVIENYFRLKDEPYEPKMMTKTADYVKEQKEAEKLYSQYKYEDLIDEFIKKYAMTKQEIGKLALIPDESTFKNFIGRTSDDKKSMINDFKILKKKLTENKNLGTDVFTYLKTYFDNYQYNLNLIDLYEHVNIDDYLKKKVFYNNNDTYQRVFKMNNLNSLKDLYDKNIKKFGNIDLNLLNNLISKFKKIKEIYTKNKDYCELDNLPPAFASVNTLSFDLNLIPKLNNGKGGGEEEDEEAFKKILELYNELGENDRQVFDNMTEPGTFEGYEKERNAYLEDLEEKEMKPSNDLMEILSYIENENVFKKYKQRSIEPNKPIEPIENTNEEDQKNFEKILELYEELNGKDKNILRGITAVEINKYEEYEKEKKDYLKYAQNKKVKKSEKLEKILDYISNVNIYNKVKDYLKEKEIEKEESESSEEETEEEKREREKREELIKNIKFTPEESITNIENMFEQNKLNLSTYKAYLSIYNPIISTLLKKINRIEKINTSYTTMSDLIDKITAEGLNYFDTTVKIQIVIDLINSQKVNKKAYKLTGLFWLAPGKKNINFSKSTAHIYESNDQKIVNQSVLTQGIKSNKETHNFIRFVCVDILNVVITSIETAGEYLKTNTSFTNNVGYGWTDKTLTRIEKITDTLRNVSNVSSGLSTGWTDDTLTRIEKITDTLRSVSNSSSGRVNPALLRVMNRRNISTGWTDDTLTRIEKINDSLKEYI